MSSKSDGHILNIHKSVENLVCIVVIEFHDVKVSRKSAKLWAAIDTFAQELRNTYISFEKAREDLAPARRLYRQIGLDPTKNRPSSEALLRRIIKNRDLYQVNSVVDVCNLCSLKFLLPIGLYDLDKIEAPITLRLGQDEEGYEGIGKGWINLSGKIALFDSQGPFGNPSSDSARTKITLITSKILFVIFAPLDYDEVLLVRHKEYAIAQMTLYNGGRVGNVCFL